MENIIIVVIVVAVLIIGIKKSKKQFKGEGGCCSSGDYKARKKKLDSVVDKKTVYVEGMMCQHCVNRVQEAVDDIKGAAGNVNLKKGTVVVSMDHEITDDEIRNAIEKAGYKVTGIEK